MQPIISGSVTPSLLELLAMASSLSSPSTAPMHTTLTSCSSPTLWFSAFGTLFSIVSVIIATRAYRTSAVTLRAKVGLDALALLEGDGGILEKQRHILDRLVGNGSEGGEKLDILLKIYRLKDRGEGLHEMLRAYDKMGHLVRFGIIPVDFLFEFYSRPIAEAWKHLEPFVGQLRNESKHPNHLKQFEILAIGAALYRQNKNQMQFHPEEKWIFEVDLKQRKNWERWRKKKAWMKI